MSIASRRGDILSVLPRPGYSRRPGYEQMLEEREKWLNERFGDYLDSLTGASSQYSSLLNRLIGDALSGSQFSIGVSGGPTLSFVPGRILERLASLGNTQMQTAMLPAATTWAWQQQQPIYSAAEQFLNYLGNVAGQSEGRRYGVQSEIVTSSGRAHPLTVLGTIGQLASTGMDIYGRGKTLGWWG